MQIKLAGIAAEIADQAKEVALVAIVRWLIEDQQWSMNAVAPILEVTPQSAQNFCKRHGIKSRHRSRNPNFRN